MILPPATLGVLGGGQLGRYFVIAAHELGYRVMVLDPDAHSVAGRIADEHLTAAYDDQQALDRMAQSCAAVTTEFESVPADALAYLARFVTVRPGAETVAICQDRGAEKNFLNKHGFPHVPYAAIGGEDDVKNAPAGLFPGILKVVRCGYDGKGQMPIVNREAGLAAFQQFNALPCVLEKQLTLDGEISVVLTRDAAGKTRCFPSARNHHRHGILDYSVVPAVGVPVRLLNQAREIAEGIATKMDYIGTLAVEFFIAQDVLYVNEIAPRPHNSGHYTLDACVTHQFEQQVRALCGLPLGEVHAHCAAVMVNLLGDLWYPDSAQPAREPDWHTLLSVPNLKLHLYGKQQVRPGRKMGHFTVLGENPEALCKIALAARTAIGIRDK